MNNFVDNLWIVLKFLIYAVSEHSFPHLCAKGLRIHPVAGLIKK